MPLPSEWGTRTVERTYIEWGTGTPLSGTVAFLANVPVENMSESIVILPKKITGNLDGNGKLSIALPVTDDVDMRNYNFTYKVTETLTYAGGGAYEDSYNIYVPTGGGVLQLGAQAPVPSSAGVVVVGGTAGKSAYQVAVDNGFVGSESAWLASLVGPASTTPGPDGDPGPSVYDLWLVDHPGQSFADFLLTLKGAPGDVSGLAAIATSGRLTDAIDYAEPMLIGERQDEDILADRVMLQVRYTGGAYEVAADTTRLCRVFTGPVDPGSAANEDDIWFVLP